MIFVGKESYCHYQSIQAAINDLEKNNSDEATSLYILSGHYHEQVIIKRSNLKIKGIGLVVIEYGLSANTRDEFGSSLGTFRTPTLYIGGSHNQVENLTVINSAGYGKEVGQAIAVYADCDETIFRNCRMIGYQDTLFTGRLPDVQKDGSAFNLLEASEKRAYYRQVYESCYISGSVDFIFGGAQAYFHQCELNSRSEDKRLDGYVTAASTPQNQEFGFIFKACWLTAESGVAGVYLGRPWRPYAKTTFIDCYYGDHIHPSGWHDWDKAINQETVTYEEQTERKWKRVRWSRVSNKLEKNYELETIFPNSHFYKKDRDLSNEENNKKPSFTRIQS